jgi:signal transduction histidine kinase
LILDYRDNGEGMNPKIVSSSKTKGLGLGNIDNRVKTIDGKYEIITNKDKGFQFILTKEV